ncbi:MAG: hypothetical protein Q8Q09_17155 [Deltaproteobacteria bacterium]|nr:hypothetical protein [Deltaproteobacteria bacterium]
MPIASALSVLLAHCAAEGPNDSGMPIDAPHAHDADATASMDARVDDASLGVDSAPAVDDALLSEDGAIEDSQALPAMDAEGLDVRDAGRDVAADRVTDARSGEAIPAARLALLRDRVGFGRNARGGEGGSLCRVRSLANSGAGTLRECVTGPTPRWVVFDVSGTIQLTDFLRIGSFKTVDGRGANVTIAGRALWLDGAEHVILANLTLTRSVIPAGLGFGGDAITMFGAAHDVWVDHCTLSDSEDGLIDMVEGATDITISWSRFQNHSKVMLVGLGGTDTAARNSRITIHHSFFDRTVQRHPRTRFGRVHAFNNFFRQWGSYGISSTWDALVFSERNVYEAGPSTRALVTDLGDGEPRGNARSSGDRMLNGAVVESNNATRVLTPTYLYTAETADSALQARVQAGAGRRDVSIP